MTRVTKASVHVETPIEAWIVYEPLPSKRGSGLFEVHAHDNEELLLQFLCDLGQTIRILETGMRIVNGARADDHQETIVSSP